MLQITHSPGSPFVRKVRLSAAIKKLGGTVEFLASDSTGAADLRASNPLQKIPTARLADGTLIYDSHVICEYLDTLGDAPRLFPAHGPRRWQALTLAALADGITEAAVLILYEGRFRPEELRHQGWVDRQQAKVDAGLQWLEANVPDLPADPDYGHISLACALGFLDARQGPGWRKTCARLADWLDRFAAAVPAWAETAPPPPT